MKRLHGSYGAANLSLEAAKATLRERMRTERRRLALSRAPLSSAGIPPEVLQDITGASADAGVVAGYAPRGSELDPAPLITALVEAGWIACLPRAGDVDGALTFHAADGPLSPDAFGIPAPPPTAPALTPDLVIVPLLAFDRFGGRLGQGAGCYDRSIAALREKASVRVIGLGYADQEVDRVPTANHDQRLDGILTTTGFIEVIDAPP